MCHMRASNLLCHEGCYDILIYVALLNIIFKTLLKTALLLKPY